MTANQLRVGNWVNLEFVGPFQWEYTHFEEYIKDKAHGYDVEGCIISDKIEPIPLTPEILEKAGFEESGFYLYKDDVRLYTFHSDFTVDEGFIFDYGMVKSFANIIYLHQLQNLYFALTGTELEINL